MSTTSAPGEVVAADMSPRRLTVLAAVAGIVSGVATLAIAEVVSLFLGGVGNPILSVGSLVIDITPAGFTDLVIALFGTADKLVLFICLGLLTLVLAVAVGILQVRRPPWGAVLLAFVAAIAVVAALTRAGATVADAVPTVAGAAGGILLLRALVARLRAWRDASAVRAPTPSGAHVQVERRSFLRLAFAIGVTGAIVAAGARVMNAAATAVKEIRSAIGLPSPASAAPDVTAEATLDVPGISEFVTPNDEFYRIDTALQVPSLDPADWSLRITGMVENEVEIGFDELLALPLQERYITLACVSNEVGGDLIGNALWLGYPIRELLKRAGPLEGADMVLSASIDGFTASTPLEVLQDENTDALLAVGMNGELLPLEHGFPVRMVVPGLYGYVSATKWVVALEVTRFADQVAYWTTRGWSARGPIKLSSRVDTPHSGDSVPAGRVVVAGVAWAQHVGVSRVQVRIDDGDWADAVLAKAVTADTWLQWSYDWDASSGNHDISVRATDSDGLVQTAAEAPPAPDGATGLHSIRVQVG